MKLVNLKENQPQIFTGWAGAEAEALVLWLPDAKSRLIGKTLMLGKTEGRRGDDRRKGGWMTSPTQRT